MSGAAREYEFPRAWTVTHSAGDLLKAGAMLSTDDVAACLADGVFAPADVVLRIATGERYTVARVREGGDKLALVLDCRVLVPRMVRARGKGWKLAEVVL